MQGLFESLVQGILYSMVSYGRQESMTKTVSCRLSTVSWFWLTLKRLHSHRLAHLNAHDHNTGSAFKASLAACIAKLLYLNWIAGFRAWRVKDNSSRASLAGCQWTMQSRPQLSAASRAHAEVHIRRDSIRWFDGSVIAASVCPQLEFKYSPPITCYYLGIGFQSVFTCLHRFPVYLKGSIAPLIKLFYRQLLSSLLKMSVFDLRFIWGLIHSHVLTDL